MTAPTEATVVELFDQLEPQAGGARSRQKRIDDLVALHEVVGHRYAEHAYMELACDPGFIDDTMSKNDVGARLEADLNTLLRGAAKVREARHVDDKATHLLAEARLTNAYFRRHNAICTHVILAPRGGRA